MKLLLTSEQVERTLKRITHEIIELGYPTEEIVLAGILSKGYIISEKIATHYEVFTGEKVTNIPLEISPYRDDEKKTSLVSNKQFDLKNKIVILIDDVLFTGRSAKAAFDAVTNQGRPKIIKLAVLIDRGHREIPIRPDFVGKNIPTHYDDIIKFDTHAFDVFVSD